MKRYLETELGGFPNIYQVEADSQAEVMENVMHTLIAETTNASVKRVLEADEVDKLREEYTTLTRLTASSVRRNSSSSRMRSANSRSVSRLSVTSSHLLCSMSTTMSRRLTMAMLSSH